MSYAYTDVSPLPDVGDVVNHAVFDDVTAHAPEACNCMNTPVPAFVAMSHVVRSTVNTGPDPAPGWVIDTVRVTAGLPDVVVNVMVAVRDDVEVFAAAFSVAVASPDPDVGDTVAHV